MTIEDFRGYMQKFTELVNSKDDISASELAERKGKLLNIANYKWMQILLDSVEKFGSDKEHNKEVIDGFAELFEYSFNPPDFAPKTYLPDEPWWREYQILWVKFNDNFYPTDYELIHILINLTCRRVYQIWEARAKERRE